MTSWWNIISREDGDGDGVFETRFYPRQINWTHSLKDSPKRAKTNKIWNEPFYITLHIYKFATIWKNYQIKKLNTNIQSILGLKSYQLSNINKFFVSLSPVSFLVFHDINIFFKFY